MPTVKTESIHVAGGSWKLKINCDAGGVFSARLPDWMHSILGKEEVSGKTLSECRRAFHEECGKYEKSKTSTRKVIVWETKFNDEISFSEGVRLAVRVGIYIETKIEGEGKPSYTYEEERGTSIPAPMCYGRMGGIYGRSVPANCMEWTQEREDFFAKIGIAMNKIIETLVQLKDPKASEQLADSGTLFLPTSEKPTSKKTK